MPKVSSLKIWIDGKYVKFDIFYNKTDMFHIKGFPDEIRNLSDDPSPYNIASNHDTEDSLVKRVRKAVFHYHENKKSTRKVILVQLAATANIAMNRIGEGHWSGNKPGIPNNLETINVSRDGWGFILDYQILMEVTHGGTKYHYIREDGSLGVTRHVKEKDVVIEWTQEREDYLKEVCELIEQVAKKAAALFCSKEELLLSIENKTKLLK